MMDLVEATQVINDETTKNNVEDEDQIGFLKIGSESHAIYKGFNRIGRSPLCRVVVDDVTVSKVHAEIQGGGEIAFISDLRSSNGTKIKDVALKPFFYYTINDGDVIYFGRVKAEYSTAVKAAEPDDFVVPETPFVSKNRNLSEKRNSGIGNVSESFLNNSSIYDSDVSLIPGTQENEKKQKTFHKPSNPVVNSPASSSSRIDDVARVTDIHEMETQNYVDVSCRPPASKRIRLQRIRHNALDNQTNIYEAETQAMPIASPKRKEPERLENQDDIFNAETQAMPLKIINQRVSRKSQNDDDIYGAETQVLPITIVEQKEFKKSRNDDDIFEMQTQALPLRTYNKKNSKKSQNQEDIYDAETQAMEILSPKSTKKGSKINEKNIYDAETQGMEMLSPKSTRKASKINEKNIYDAETQGMEMLSPKSTRKASKINEKNIYDAETQAMEILSPKSTKKGSKINEKNIYDAETQAMEISSPKSVEKEIPENIYEMATQVMSISLQNNEKNTIAVCSSSSDNNNRLFNETAESSIQSNASRNRLRLSSSSPENLDDISESQNLLEIVETPLLDYEKFETKKSSQEPQKKSKDVDEEEKDVGEKKSPYRRRVQTIPESSDSETDDEGVTMRVSRKSKPSNVIEDSSDEPTDEENVFGGSAIRSEILRRNTKKTSTATREGEGVGKLEVNKVRSSPLHLKKKPEVSSENIISGETSNGEKSRVSISGGFPSTVAANNEKTSPRKIAETSTRDKIESNKAADSPTRPERKTEEISMKKVDEPLRSRLGASPLRLSRKREENSSSAKIDKFGEIRQAKANLFCDKKIDDLSTKKPGDQESKKCGDSPRKNDDSLMKNCEELKSKKFDTPTIIFENGEELSIEKSDEKLINEFDASTSTKNQVKTSGKSKNDEKTSEKSEKSKNREETSEKSKDQRETSKNEGKISKNAKNQIESNIIGNSPKKNDPSSKIEGQSISSNKFGRSSLRLSRKNDNNYPKKIDEKIGKNSTKTNRFGNSPLRKDLSTKIIEKKIIDDEDEDNIFEIATQRINPTNLMNSDEKTDNKSRDLGGTTSIDDDIDIDLLPTQILDLPSSTPFSRRMRTGRTVARQKYDGDDIHGAPTQIINLESPGRENVENDILAIVDNDEVKIVDNKEKKKAKEKTIDLDDSLAVNLGNLLGEEANNDHFNDDDDATQLMTQNLVDILRPTQSFCETEPRGRKSSPRVTENLVGQGTFDSPLRKRIYAPGTLGFVDGEAKDSGELVSADSSPIKAAKADKNIVETDKVDELNASASHHDQEDIFFGLPEVKIAGTLSNPGSPVSSSASSLDEFLPIIKNISEPKNFGTKRSSSSSKFFASTDPESPITPKKSRITRRDPSRYRITDDVPDDSDDDFDYQDLKRMADRLLATESSYDTKIVPKNDIAIDEKIDEIPVSAGRSRKGKKKIVETKEIAITKKSRATKLSCGPSSLIVSDAKIEAAGESRKSSRQRKPTKIAAAAAAAAASSSATAKVVAKQQQQQQSGSKESQEIEAILGSSLDENQPMISRKSYVKVQLTRLDDSGKEKEDGDKISNAFERPKVTRTRRTISAVKKEAPSPLASPAKRVRRTIAETPGIPGNNKIDHKIMFTGVNTDEYCKIVEKLGGTVVAEPSKATVLITDKVRRTYKFLCAVAYGIRIVSINWLLESNKASTFLDCDNFILREPDAEAKYKFTLEKSLRIAKTKKFLDGYTIVITPKVNEPNVQELKAMVDACGGRLLVRPPGPRSWNAKTVIISREEDYAVAKAYLAKVPKNLKITVQSKEFILTGILRQEVNFVEHKLDFA